MLTTSSAPPAACVVIGPLGLQASSQIVTRDPHAGDDEQRAVDGRRREVALLVEHRVVRQEVLAVDALHAPVRAHRGGVVEVALAPRGSRRPRRVRPVRAATFSSASALRHERRAQQEVLGRIAGDASSGNATRSQPGGLGALVRLEDAVDVAVEVTDDEVELRGGKTDPGHRLRIRDTAWHDRRVRRGRVERPTSTPRSSARPTHARPACSWSGRSRRIPTSPRSWPSSRSLRDGLVALACASRSLSSAVVADATLLDPLRDPDDGRPRADRRRPTERLARRRTPTIAGGLRRWKRRELLRIAARDLLGVADLPAVGRRARRARRRCAWRPRSSSSIRR